MKAALLPTIDKIHELRGTTRTMEDDLDRLDDMLADLENRAKNCHSQMATMVDIINDLRESAADEVPKQEQQGIMHILEKVRLFSMIHLPMFVLSV